MHLSELAEVVGAGALTEDTPAVWVDAMLTYTRAKKTAAAKDEADRAKRRQAELRRGQ